MNMMVKSSEDTIARVNGIKRTSLALKATSHEEEESSDDGGSTYEPSKKEKMKSLMEKRWMKLALMEERENV